MLWFKKPKVLGQTAFIKMGQETAIMVYGKRFGEVGDKVQVYFTSTSGPVWTPSPAEGTVQANGWVLVHATPTGRGEKDGSGSGELSTTVSNSAGTSPAQSQSVYYCP
jgi:hypothetical protein